MSALEVIVLLRFSIACGKKSKKDFSVQYYDIKFPMLETEEL